MLLSKCQTCCSCTKRISVIPNGFRSLNAGASCSMLFRNDRVYAINNVVVGRGDRKKVQKIMCAFCSSLDYRGQVKKDEFKRAA